jgi:hypothetical protein
MKALKAVEEPRYTQPMMRITAALVHKAYTGTSHLASI